DRAWGAVVRACHEGAGDPSGLWPARCRGGLATPGLRNAETPVLMGQKRHQYRRFVINFTPENLDSAFSGLLNSDAESIGLVKAFNWIILIESLVGVFWVGRLWPVAPAPWSPRVRVTP